MNMDLSEDVQQKLGSYEEQPSEGLENELVLTKYRLAAQIAQEALLKCGQEVLAGDGKKVVDICEASDRYIVERTKSYYKTYKTMDKGIAFPTCLSVNEVVCHYSPDFNDTLTLKTGDVVRIDLGAFIDGYIGVGATTVIVGQTQPVTGKAADCLAAAEKALEVALHLIRPGNTNADVTKAIQKVCEQFGVSATEGVLSHQLKRYIIDGNNCIILKPTTENNVETFEFKDFEVYALDIVLTTGTGKLKESTHKTTVYKRNPDVQSALKRKSAEDALKDIQTKATTMPFSVRHLDPKTGKLGLLELFRAGVVDPLPILNERSGEFVAHYKTTVHITRKEIQKAVKVPIAQYASDKSITDAELLQILNTPLTKKPATGSSSMDISN